MGLIGGVGSALAKAGLWAGKAGMEGTHALINDLTGQPSPGTQPADAVKQFADQSAAQVPQEPATPPPFVLPELDSSLSNAGQKAKAQFEKDNPGQTYVPNENDYTDAGPEGYLHKQKIHDLMQEYEKELEANRPHIDYAGIMKNRLADLATMPAPHRNNPALMFAMAMGNPEHATELVKQYTENNKEASTQDLQKWQDLLQTKQDAIKGAMQQAMQVGDMRRVVSQKYADQLMEIEHAKSLLAGQIEVAKTKGAETARTATIRAEAAKAMVDSRMKAMLQAVGMKTDSAEARAKLDSATRRIDARVAKGEDPLTVADDVMTEIHDELDSRVHTTHGGTVLPPAAPNAAPATSKMSPLKQAQWKRQHPGQPLPQ